MTGSGSGSGNKQDFQDENQLSRPIQRHLARVYATLTGVSASAAIGSYTWTQGYIPFDPTVLSIFGLVLFAGVMFTRGSQHIQSVQLARLGALNLFGLFQGIRIGPLISTLIRVDPALVIQGLVLTLLIFASFTGSALFARRRTWITYGGLLSSILSLLLVAGLFNLFFASSTLFSIELYLGLFAFAGFVAYDTQMIVERADLGDRDYVGHGADLFVDLFGILVRIFIILARKEEGNDNNSRSRKKRH